MATIDGEDRPQWLERPSAPRLAFCRTLGAGPGTVFLGGFASDMTGTKATVLEAASRTAGRAFLRFDYRGHGRSEGCFADATISDWREDALAMLDARTEGPQILVGSSMGGWIALLVALARPERVKALIGIAAAPDFTEHLVWDRLDAAQRERLTIEGVYRQPSDYGEPLAITRALIEDGRNHLLLDRPIPFAGPVRLFQGQRDADVPWGLALTLAKQLDAEDVRVMLIKDGDHRLSRPQDLALIVEAVEELMR